MNESKKNLTVFSIRLKELREKASLTQIQLAEILHTSKQSIWNYETSNREPNINMLIEMAKYFNVTIDYLTGNSNVQNPQNQTILDCISENITIPDDNKEDVLDSFNEFIKLIRLFLFPSENFESGESHLSYLRMILFELHTYLSLELLDYQDYIDLMQAAINKDLESIENHANKINMSQENAGFTSSIYSGLLKHIEHSVRYLKNSYRINYRIDMEKYLESVNMLEDKELLE